MRNGMTAYDLLTKLQSGDKSDDTRPLRRSEAGSELRSAAQALHPNVTDATDEQIKAAVDDSIPQVLPLFFAFRIMVACGILMLVLIGLAFWRQHPPQDRRAQVAAQGAAVRHSAALDRHRGGLVCR